MGEAWIPVVATSAMTGEEPVTAGADGEEIVIYRIDEEYFATSNICTHGFARLSEGYLEGCLIECPLHQGLFDIRDGKCADGPVYIDLKSYDVRVMREMIEVRLRD